MMKASEITHTTESCNKARIAIQDTLEVISGKWKLVILVSLLDRPYRFKELAREISITPRMLSKELQDLETNMLVSRTVLNTKPISVEYAITDYGRTFSDVLNAMAEWGAKHRRTIIADIQQKQHSHSRSEVVLAG